MPTPTTEPRAEPRSELRNLAAAARRIPSARINGFTHPATVIRWILNGVQIRGGGRLRLEALKTPGGWLVSDAAVDEFLAKLTAARMGEPAPASPSATAAEERERARVSAELDHAGIR
jgi:hypothetical protein